MPSQLDALFLHVPRNSEGRREIMVMPLGIPALANLLTDEGYRASIVHLGLSAECEPGFSLSTLLRRTRPKLVLLSLHWQLQTRGVIGIAQQVRRCLPDATIALGGLTASVFAEEAVGRLRFIDAVVRGDGELPLLELTRCVTRGNGDWSHVPNLVWRADGEALAVNPATWVLEETMAEHLRHGSLELLQQRNAYLTRKLYADFSEGTPESVGYPGATYLNGGRGCMSRCLNCGGSLHAQIATSFRRGLLLYPLQKLRRDVDEAVAEGATVLRTSFDPVEARPHLCQWFAAIRAAGHKLRTVYDLWHLPDDKLLSALSSTFESGSIVLVSPECGSEELRARFRGVGYSNDELLDALHRCEGVGLVPHCFFAAGLPTETPEEVDDSVRLIERIRRETQAGVSVCPMVVDPASRVFSDPERYGVRLLRTTLQDYYDEVGLPNGPGYETAYFDEGQVLAACDRLLDAAGIHGHEQVRLQQSREVV